MQGGIGSRIVIVRSDAIELYEQLMRRFGSDGLTMVIYDRRKNPCADAGKRERRQGDESDVLTQRGFYVIRPIRSRSPKWADGRLGRGPHAGVAPDGGAEGGVGGSEAT